MATSTQEAGSIEILDTALTARIGYPDERTAEAIKEEATSAFIYGLSEPAALDLARGLHWMSQGHPLVCSSEYILEVLSPVPLSPERGRELVNLLDVSYTISYERQSTRIPITSSQPLLWLDAAMIGWHVYLALELLNYDQVMADSP
jgi:hypothetical protein